MHANVRVAVTLDIIGLANATAFIGEDFVEADGFDAIFAAGGGEHVVFVAVIDGGGGDAPQHALVALKGILAVGLAERAQHVARAADIHILARHPRVLRVIPAQIVVLRLQGGVLAQEGEPRHRGGRGRRQHAPRLL